ncbi:zinc ABC transporter substrate-binding protein [bacterium]|nr:zinc ABC transporter substrate-binding protein [candidate division CSSED10-310 bacterium]
MVPVIGNAALTGSAASPADAGQQVDVLPRISVFVSILPQVTFAERIGGDRITVHTLVQPGHSPATYEPSPRQMAAMADAALFFRIGVAFENALIPKIQVTMPDLIVVDTRQNIPLRHIESHRHPGDGQTHHSPHRSDDPHDDHVGEAPCLHGDEPDGNDPHIWLSPRLVKIQARTMADALIAIDPSGTDGYERNLAALIAELDALDAELALALQPVKGKTFLVFHPAWGYFADAYGLKQEAIEMEGKEPSARQMVRLIDQARAEGIRIVFVQPQFGRNQARTVAEAIDGAVVTIDPLAADYFANLRGVVETITGALQEQKKP